MIRPCGEYLLPVAEDLPIPGENRPSHRRFSSEVPPSAYFDAYVWVRLRTVLFHGLCTSGLQLAMLAEDGAQTVGDLADRGIHARRIHDRRHQIVAPAAGAFERRQFLRHRALAAARAH